MKTAPGTSIPVGSDRHHQDALHKTCKLVNDTKFTLEANELTELFKLRLSNFYKFIADHKIKIINVYPPVNHHLDLKDNDLRRAFWEKEFSASMINQKFDLSNVIPSVNNEAYYYDLIHLNEKGMEIFTDALADSLLKHAI